MNLLSESELRRIEVEGINDDPEGDFAIDCLIADHRRLTAALEHVAHTGEGGWCHWNEHKTAQRPTDCNASNCLWCEIQERV